MNSTTTAPGWRAGLDGSNRRAHPRIASTELPETALIRIPKRPPVALVDLSAGGALLELPFQLLPDSQVFLELITSSGQITVPFNLLRCHVAKLQDGVHYHAAGAFNQLLKLPPILAGALTQPAVSPLIKTLEGFLRASQGNTITSRAASFNEMLLWVVSLLRRGEASSTISTQIKAHVVQMFPSLLITPASSSLLRNASTSARFFGIDFKSERTLTVSDRRFLRAAAQLIALVDRDAARSDAEAGHAILDQQAPTSEVVHTVSEWQALSASSNPVSFRSKWPEEAFFAR
jgi:hypothetical protein